MFRELRVGFSRSLRSGPVAETPKTYYIIYVYRRWRIPVICTTAS